MRVPLHSLLLALALCMPLPALAQKSDQVARTPQMGWNSWNTFGCNVDERMIREMADAMVASGMKDAGYEYINIDDCWHGTRDADGNIRPDPKTFPSGMKALADYVHARGLKLGIYSDAGNTTCAGRPGSRGHEYQDALAYARWGIDYVKYDWCDTKDINPVSAYTTMRDAIARTGRPMLFSICEWGDNKPWEWALDVGHSWRTTGDIYPCWSCEHNHGSWSSLGVLPILDKQAGLRKYAGPGRWNDMDMMEVGNGMTEEEDRAHFSLWAMLASPLIAGNDLRSMGEATRRILTHRGMIAISQDRLGIQAMKWIDEGEVELYLKPLDKGEYALLFLNRGDAAREYTLDWAFHYMKDDISKREIDFGHQRFAWRDVWHGGEGSTAQAFTATLPAHGVVVLRLAPR
ncbi:alpha-galactosidase Aga27 [Pseudoxanthomonas sp.]|uniref:alpha-galactosidase Aga27 n=1 Tax=Pseudoxanthomonas sp. TaxID=1871049 RepID=UPI00258E1272|nr:alpha-galactosidase Aga27 [Pseudoxanthomonas sp.]MCR6686962.1 glycoside hydrolase family 27 protein [Pseudoxanthomonas sp.]